MSSAPTCLSFWIRAESGVIQMFIPPEVPALTFMALQLAVAVCWLEAGHHHTIHTHKPPDNFTFNSVNEGFISKQTRTAD